MLLKNKSYLNNPFILGGFILSILMLFYAADRGWNTSAAAPMKSMEVWAYICTANMVFIMYSSVYLIVARNVNTHLKKTILAFGALFLTGILLGSLIGDGNILYSTGYRGVLIAELAVFFVCMGMAVLIARTMHGPQQRK